MRDIGTLGGTNSYGMSINASGQVTGISYTIGNTAQHAFLYQDGTMQDLGALSGAWSYGFGINDGGQVTGTVMTANNVQHAFLYSGGQMLDLDTLAGAAAALTMVSGQAINDVGQVTGYGTTTSGAAQDHAFLYSNGYVQDLGVLEGGNWSYGYGLNSLGQVVGRASTKQHGETAFLYASGQIIDLNTAIGSAASLYTLLSAQSINDSGQIVGYGYENANSNSLVALLLTPTSSVPLPGSILLFISGLGALGMFRREVVLQKSVMKKESKLIRRILGIRRHRLGWVTS